MRSTRPPQDRKFGCPKCEKKFFTPKDLRRHENTHLGLREHVCSSCHTRFGRKDHLTRHSKKSCSAKRAATGQQLQVALQQQQQQTLASSIGTTGTHTTATTNGRNQTQTNNNSITNTSTQPHLQPQAQPQPHPQTQTPTPTQPQTQPQPHLQLHTSNHHLQQQHQQHLNQHHYHHQVNGFYCENQTDETLCLYCDKTICNCALVASQNGGRVHQLIGGEFNYCQSTIVNEPTYQQQQLYEYYI